VSNLIDFLERLGQDAQLRSANDEQMDEALRNAGLEPSLREVIFGEDRQTLEVLLDADANVCCMVYKEDEEEEEEPEEEEEDDEDDEDEKDDEKDLLEA
jgi:hypothetical protein